MQCVNWKMPESHPLFDGLLSWDKKISSSFKNQTVAANERLPKESNLLAAFLIVLV